jgi:hypothetical protein
MSNNENPSRKAKADALLEVESDHVEAAPTAGNPPATAGPNDSFLEEKTKYQLRVKKLTLRISAQGGRYL